MSSPVEAPIAAETLPFDLLPSGPGDRFFDYCLQPYAPRRSPRGKLRSENLLWYSLAEAGLLEQARPPLLALQQALGRDMLVARKTRPRPSPVCATCSRPGCSSRRTCANRCPT